MAVSRLAHCEPQRRHVDGVAVEVRRDHRCGFHRKRRHGRLEREQLTFLLDVGIDGNQAGLPAGRGRIAAGIGDGHHLTGLRISTGHGGKRELESVGAVRHRDAVRYAEVTGKARGKGSSARSVEPPARAQRLQYRRLNGLPVGAEAPAEIVHRDLMHGRAKMTLRLRQGNFDLQRPAFFAHSQADFKRRVSPRCLPVPRGTVQRVAKAAPWRAVPVLDV